MPALAYAVDGLVVKVDSFGQQERLGFTARSPRWGIAYKYPAQQATSIVKDVIFSVGRTGAITPVAKVEPVFCAGVTISSVTLHNFSEIERLGLRVGDRVLIERAGEVIPKVVKVVEKAKKAADIAPPKKCPDCGSAVIRRRPGGLSLRCVSCPAQLRGLWSISPAAGHGHRGAGRFGGGPAGLAGLVKDVAGIYDLTKEKLLGLELFRRQGRQSPGTDRASKEKTLDRVLFALGIRHVGEKTETITKRMDLDGCSKPRSRISRPCLMWGRSSPPRCTLSSPPPGRALVSRLKDAGLTI